MKLKFIPGLLIMLLVVALPLFSHLDELPLQNWDEARLAENAFEMDHDHNYVVTHFFGNPDMWNTKPPLMIWLQVLFINILGMSELAVRLPATLAALATCLLIYWFLAKKLQTPLLGWLSCLVLITIPGYVGLHGTRTGDYDALVVLFLTAYSIYFYLYLEEGKRKYLALTFAAIILAGLTKGIAGLMLLPALFLYTIYKKKLLIVVKESYLYIGICSFVVVVIGYYFLREHYNPGYINAVKNNELGGRYSTVLENHYGGGNFYFRLLSEDTLKYWFLPLVAGTIFGLQAKLKWLRDLSVFLLLLIVSYFLVINSAETKIPWYVMPLYPFASIIVAIFIYSVCQMLDMLKVQDQFRQNVLPLVFIILLCFMPYRDIIESVSDKNSGAILSPENADLTQFLSFVLHGKRTVDSCTVVTDMDQNMVCYQSMFAYTHKPVQFSFNGDFKNATRIVTSLSSVKRHIDSNYYNSLLGTYNTVSIYRLDSMKHMR